LSGDRIKIQEKLSVILQKCGSAAGLARFAVRGGLVDPFRQTERFEMLSRPFETSY
jgi:hypothetical protein